MGPGCPISWLIAVRLSAVLTVVFRNFQLAAVNQGNRTFRIWKSETRQKSFGFMKVRMYEFEERRKVKFLQLAGKVDLRSKANISGVCWPILLIFWNFDRNGKSLFFWEYEGDWSKLRFENGSFSVNRRSYWAEIPGDRSQPPFYPGKIFFSEHFY